MESAEEIIEEKNKIGKEGEKRERDMLVSITSSISLQQ